MVYIFYTIYHEEVHFMGNMGEEDTFYWLFEKTGAMLLSKIWRRKVKLSELWQKLCWLLAGVSFYGPCPT